MPETSLETLHGLVKDGILTLADAAKRADLTPSEFLARTIKTDPEVFLL